MAPTFFLSKNLEKFHPIIGFGESGIEKIATSRLTSAFNESGSFCGLLVFSHFFALRFPCVPESIL